MSLVYLVRSLLLVVVMLLSPMAMRGYERDIYISSTTGDDSNPGTRKQPLRTINSLTKEQRTGSRIMLKRGDVFFDYLRDLTGCEVTTYGKGDKPVVCGFRVLSRPSAWHDEGDGVWSLKLDTDSDFVGIDSRVASIPWRFYDIGCIYNPQTDSIMGHMVKSRADLKAPGDIFTSSYFKKEDYADRRFDTVYLRFDVNPATFGNLCFPVFEMGVSNIKDTKVRNISFVGFSWHGAAIMTGSELRDCDFDIIGGAVQVGYSYWVRYGNGVELWSTGCNNNLVTGCLISRTYDCATTIQGTGSIPTNPHDIWFRDNKILHCRQAFEYFLNDPARDPQFVNCGFTGNTCYMMGDNGFDSPEPRDADILCYNRKPVSIPITGNLFYGAPYFCSSVANPMMRDNEVYIYPGQYLNYYYVTGYKALNAGTDGALARFRQEFGDDSRITVVTPGSTEDTRMKRRILSRLGWKPPRLHLDRILKSAR
ncbi:MAG: hypothetical protein NC117_07640 [Pseudoflavonifractor sp.]|nr:hypothetical protein [Pseudoflavonifractor sp.]